MAEYSGLFDKPSLSLFTLALARYTNNENHNFLTTPFILISDPIRNGRGLKLYDLILKGNFGEIWSSPVSMNPNSHNELQIYVFSPNDEVLKAWFLPLNERRLKEFEKYKKDRNKHISAGTLLPYVYYFDTEVTFAEQVKKTLKLKTIINNFF